MLEAPPAPIAMDPARAEALRRQLSAIAATLLDAVLAGLEAPSTGSASEQVLTRAIRPFLPRLRSAFLSRLSDADPVTLERLMSATATAIESILYYAPGEPLPRFVFSWTDAGLELRPAPGQDDT